MPETTSAGGGYSCQVCGTTHPSENELIQHGRDQHPNQPVTWGEPSEAAVRSETNEIKGDTKQGIEEAAEKIKAGAKAAGEKITHPDKDLRTEYEQKKAEERSK